VLIGLTLGLIAAVGWGAEDLIGSYVSRRVGALVTTIASSIVGLCALVVIMLVIRPPVPTDTTALLELLALGLPIGATYFAIFYALKVGPVAVVSPMMASYGVCSVVLAVAFLGEHPGAIQAAMVPVAGIGTVLCALTLEEGSWRPRVAGVGPLVAVGVVVMSAAVTVAMKSPVSHTEWLVAVFAIRLTATALVLVVGVGVWIRGRAITMRSQTPDGDILTRLAFAGRNVIVLVAAIGLFDTAGVMAFTRGLQASSAWIVALAASMSPTIVVLGATLVFREKLRPTQWIGVALVATSVVLLGVA
jgi:drug/metabolite transporter (DMT)-like permease